MGLIKIDVSPVIVETIYKGGQSEVEAYAAAHPEAASTFIHEHGEKIENWTYLRPSAAKSFMELQAAWIAKGGKLRVTDMLRTVQTQIKLKREKPALAARPGSSLHGLGLAVDYNSMDLGGKFTWKDFDKHVHQFGWVVLERAYRDNGAERWHIEYRKFPEHPFSSAFQIIDWMDNVGLTASKDDLEAAVWRVADIIGYKEKDFTTAVKKIQSFGGIGVDGSIGPQTKQLLARLDIEVIRK